MPAVRPQWHDLPQSLREELAERLEARPDEVTAYSQDGGHTPSAALRLCGPRRRLFLKALPTGHSLGYGMWVEEHLLKLLPPGVAPELVCSLQKDRWVAVVLEDIEGRYPDLSPSSPDVPLVVQAVERMCAMLAEAPRSNLDKVRVTLGWRALTPAQMSGKAWAVQHLDQLRLMERTWAEEAKGAALVHGDVRPDNMLLTGEGELRVVDWAQARHGLPWYDLAMLAPHLIMAGHTAEEAEKVLSETALWGEADGDLVTAAAASAAGYLTRCAPEPAPEASPHLRPYQARLGRAACSWVRYRTGWTR